MIDNADLKKEGFDPAAATVTLSIDEEVPGPGEEKAKRQRTITFTFGNVTLAPGQVGVVVKNVAAFQSRYANSAFLLGSYSDSCIRGEPDASVWIGWVLVPQVLLRYPETHPELAAHGREDERQKEQAHYEEGNLRHDRNVFSI